MFGALPQEITDISPQIGPYLGSNGFKYTRYSTAGMKKTTLKWLSFVRTPNDLTVQEDTIKTELRTS